MPIQEKNINQKFKPFLKSIGRYWHWVVGSLVVLFFMVVGWSIAGYAPRDLGLSSPLAPSLAVFEYNKSQHPSDPAKGCWYDSGDYVVFLQRNTLSVYYLSLAKSLSHDVAVQEDLEKVIVQQLGCIDAMLARGEKQYRDQRSHGVMVPPLLSDWMHPRATYSIKPNEGREVYLLRALIADLRGEADVAAWRSKAESRTSRIRSEGCCEEGPVLISEKDRDGLETLSFHPKKFGYGWALDLLNIAALERKRFDGIREQLETIRERWQREAPEPFAYLGGNYDIAGTIALERWYARATKDESFSALSKSLHSYLEGDNVYQVNFTDYPSPHHPCGTWWGLCRLRKTLVNGVDGSKRFDPKHPNAWRFTEVQLVGQAEYVLMRVLYEGL